MHKLFIVFNLTAIIILFNGCKPTDPKTFWLDETKLDLMETGWSSNKSKKSIDGNTLTINGKTFERGVGTHATSKLMIRLNKNGVRFKAFVGVDDEVSQSPASLEFFVLGDKKILWQSGIMTDSTDEIGSASCRERV